MELDLKGRVAIVGGSSKGIGKATALRLAQEGANVTIVARHAEDVATAAQDIAAATSQDQVLAIPADLSKVEDTKRVAQETVDRWGRLDIVVNNIGGPPPGDPVELSDDQWLAALEQNFLSAVRMSREALPHMRRQRWGRIINLLSTAVKEPVPSLVLSTVSRMAAVGFAKMLADEVAKDGITVNNVLPGQVLTDRLKSLANTWAQAAGITVEEQYQRMMQKIPVGRLGEPAEMADLICFLASERAAFINGISIALDGGQTRATL